MNTYAVSITLRRKWFFFFESLETTQVRVKACGPDEAYATVACQIELTRRMAELDRKLQVEITAIWLVE